LKMSSGISSLSLPIQTPLRECRESFKPGAGGPNNSSPSSQSCIARKT
jgi:hypothetical protein